ncbi:GT-D fold domain-containing glycosyltransferase [Cohnella soli]|uniref:GT-D fold domain-containing glycosyltransferase n=1 Tax=Cohnella soli TaxID=425005 RepID=A0ABW0HZ86_9BACL
MTNRSIRGRPSIASVLRNPVQRPAGGGVAAVAKPESVPVDVVKPTPKSSSKSNPIPNPKPKPKSKTIEVLPSPKRRISESSGKKRKTAEKTAPRKKAKLTKRKSKPRLRKRKFYRGRQAVAMDPLIDEDEDLSEARGSYDKGYLEGANAAGEKLLEMHLPPDTIIPDVTVQEAIAAGVQQLRNRGVPLLDGLTVYQEMAQAVQEKKPYAFVRLGDGELLTLAQDKVLTVEEVRKAGPFLPYAGIRVPNLHARDEIVECLKHASLVGVPLSRHPHFQPLLFAVLRAHGIDYRQLRYTSSTMNYLLHEQGLLQQLMSGRRIITVGNVADKLAHVLAGQGFSIVGMVTPVNGYADVHRVVAEASAYDYDIALVAAGVPAIPIVVHLAGIGGRVVIDFGHLANRIAGLEFPDRNDSYPDEVI